MERIASRLAGAGAASLDGASMDVVDLSVEMVALMSAKTQFAVDLSTLKTAGQIQGNLIDLMA
jgi:flagellar basal body rod protein FlgC